MERGLVIWQMILHHSWKRCSYGNEGEEKPSGGFAGGGILLLIFLPECYFQHNDQMHPCGEVQSLFAWSKR